MTYKRKKYHFGDTHLKKKWRTKRRTKDLDQVMTFLEFFMQVIHWQIYFQVDADLKPEVAQKLLNQPTDLDKPGQGQFYCIHCAKHFIDQNAFNDHVKSKPHKRRLHALKTEPYTIEESERAAGMGSYRQPQKRKMETMIPESMKSDMEVEEGKKKAKLEEETK